jgi:ABC-type histidine transport system ATPase subunit
MSLTFYSDKSNNPIKDAINSPKVAQTLHIYNLMLKKYPLKDLNEQGKTIVIATHESPMIRRFPARIITVDEQKIFETVITKKENK